MEAILTGTGNTRQRPSEITVIVWKSDGKLFSEQLMNSNIKRLNKGLINQYLSDNTSMFTKKITFHCRENSATGHSLTQQHIPQIWLPKP